MGKFLTTASRIEQLSAKGKYKLLDNELYLDDDGSIYLAWRGFQTDNFTWINSSDWDIRCSHLHDIGCEYHQLVRVLPDVKTLLYSGYLRNSKGKTVLENVPSEYLTTVNVTGHEINNLFYRMLKSADCPKTPKTIQYLYRAGVCFNFGWFFTGDKDIDLKNLYI